MVDKHALTGLSSLVRLGELSLASTEILLQIQDYQVSKDVYLSPDIEGRGERLRRFHDWTGSTVRLVMDLIHMLSKILHACDRFQSQDYEYFQDDNAFHKDTISPSLCLAVIAKHVEEMKDQLHTLQHLERMCNNISREVCQFFILST